MLLSTLSAVVIGAGLSCALPIRRAQITDVTLDPVATAQAQVRDNTATRALSAVSITTSDGQCLFVDPNSGDFRENLTPVQLQPCNGTAGEQWDVITSGVHNNVPGAALIVSSLTQACLNFDPRRAVGNQVLLFSCGGRADGSGLVATSQLFNFASTPTGPIPLVPQNGNNQTCLFANQATGLLDQTNCDPSTASGTDLFTFGTSSGTASAAPASATSEAASTSSAAASSISSTEAATTNVAIVESATATATSNPLVTSGVTLNPTDVAQSQVRDNTATRALSAVSIQDSKGQCLFVDPTSGDFRENLTPVQTAECDGSASQQWDVITSGVHNNVPGAALIVSTLTQACMNFDPRRVPGNQVLLFSCGGRADGSGQVTNSQLFNFASIPTGPIPLVPQNGNNQTCLTINSTSSLLDQATPCNPTTASGTELFTFGSSSTSASAAPITEVASTADAASTTAAAASASSASAATAVTTDAATVSGTATATSNPFVTSGVTLNPTDIAQSQVRDNTAVRALSAVSIKDSNGQCLFVDPTSGDFRENLTPIQSAQCDGSANQQWDVITSGVHNNVPGAALIVSTLTEACMNFDPRRAAGNQVLLFSCGGRADGSGLVATSQLFNFASTPTAPIPLVPQNGNNQTCLTFNSQTGLVDQTSCDPSTASGSELFTFGN